MTTGITEPLATTLSQVLVAFTIEADNELEAQLAKTWARPFKTSMVMWSTFLRFVAEEGATTGEVARAGGLSSTLVPSIVGGMERWGYISVERTGTASAGVGSARGVKTETVLRPTVTGQLVQGLWPPVPEEVEQRWRRRLGDGVVEELRSALAAVDGRLSTRSVPRFMPVVARTGLFVRDSMDPDHAQPVEDESLPALLSRVLLALTLEYEAAGSSVSLPIAANVLRVLEPGGARSIAELPLAAGVSKEAVAMSLTWLEREGLVEVTPDPSGRGKQVALTSPAGTDAQSSHRDRLAAVEAGWESRLGAAAVASLRAALRAVLDLPGGEDGPLSAGLMPPPGGWRGTGRYKASTARFVADPAGSLPHHPMVLHRGGWPDGS